MDKKTHARIIKSLRREFLYSPERKAALKRAEFSPGYYTCAKCNRNFPKKYVDVDHVEPVVELGGFKDWNTFIERLFHGPLQVLCDTCHKAKTGIENKIRVRIKRSRAPGFIKRRRR